MRKSLTVLAAAIGGVVASAVGPGPAAVAEVYAQACVHSTIITGPYEGVGTTATKSSTSSCNDLNLTYANDTSPTNFDWYAGRYYKSSTRTWVTGTRGYVYVEDGGYDVDRYVLVSDLRDGTKFTVASYFEAGDEVNITH